MTVQAIEGGKKYLFLVKLHKPEGFPDIGHYDVGGGTGIAKKLKDDQISEIKQGIDEAMQALGVSKEDYRVAVVEDCDIQVVTFAGDPLLVHDEGSAFQKMREGHRDM